MPTVNIYEAWTKLSELVDLAASGTDGAIERSAHRMALISDGRHFGGVDLAVGHRGKGIQLGLQLRGQRLWIIFLLISLLCCYNFDAVLGGLGYRSHHDFYGASKTEQAVHHLHLADATKLSAQHLGELGLSQAQHLRRLLLAPSAFSQNLPNLRDQLRLYQYLFRIRKA